MEPLVPGAPSAAPPEASSEAAVRELLGAPDRKYERRITKAKQKEYPRRVPADWTKAAYVSSGLVEKLRASIEDQVPRVQVGELSEA
eukprot:7213047-Prymnesium_polylepis.1